MSYRQIFDEAIGHSPPSAVDIDRVVRRQRRAARVRPALATVAAVLLVAAGTGTAIQLTGGDGSLAPDPADRRDGWPEYIDGTRVIAGASVPMADRTLSLTFTLTDPDLQLRARCEPEVIDGDLQANMSLGDVSVEWVVCFGTASALGASELTPEPGPTHQLFHGDEEEAWADAGIEVGEEVTITIELTKIWAFEGPDQPVPSEGTFGLAVVEPVPWEEYQLPPPPTQGMDPLPDITWAEGQRPFEIRADGDDPNRPIETTIEWEDDDGGCEGAFFELVLVAQTPGRLRVLANGTEVAHETWWDYEQVEHEYDLGRLCEAGSDGAPVTITVEPEQMTGDWRVWVYNAAE